jgi:uncharacterized protein YuzE
MKVIYDTETDTLSVVFAAGQVTESDEGKPGIILDYGADGSLLSVEILDASHRMAIPDHVDFEVAATGA